MGSASIVLRTPHANVKVEDKSLKTAMRGGEGHIVLPPFVLVDCHDRMFTFLGRLQQTCYRLVSEKQKTCRR